MNLTTLDHRLDATAQSCRAIIETPKGGRAKFTYDPKAEAFELKRLLPDGMSFPLDFGFVPSTRVEDGDPIDILVLNDEPTPTGTLVAVRLIGVIEAEQSEQGRNFRNDRLLAVAKVSRMFERVRAIGDLGEAFVKNLTQFWVNYNALRGADFRVIALKGAEEAARLVGRASLG